MGTLNLGSSGKVDGNAEFEGQVTKPAHPYMMRQPNATVSVSHNTQTLVSTIFGTTHINQGGIALDTSTGRITFPVVGIYRINVKVNASSEAYWGNDPNLRPKLNGSDYLSQQLFYTGAQNKGSNAWYNPFYMNVCVNITSLSDYIELYMYQNSGSTVGLHNEFGFLEVYLIG